MKNNFSNKNSWKGYMQFFASMMMYAFSGVIVVGLGDVFGSVGQLVVRGVCAFFVVLAIMLVFHLPIRFHKTNYNWWLYFLDLLCRPFSTLFFVLAVFSFKNVNSAFDANQALFYLFSFRVIASLVIDLFLGIKTTKWNWVGLGLVLLGLVIFSFPWNIVLMGVLFAALSGIVEAIQRKIWNKLKIDDNDRWMVGLTEHIAWFSVSLFIFVITGSSVNLQLFDMATFGVLVLGTVTTVGCMWLDITAFGQEDTLAGNVIQSSEMGFAGFINFVYSQGKILMNSYQITGAFVMILALVAIGMNKLRNGLKKEKVSDESDK